MNRVFAVRALVAALGISVALVFAISWLMVSQAVVAEREPVTVTPHDYGMPFAAIEFSPRMPEQRAEEQPLTLRGWWIPADVESNTAAPVIIVVHGIDSNRTRDPDEYMPFMRRLRDEGFSLVLFDLRAHGESDGEVVSAGYYERYDVLGAMDAVTSTYGIPVERIGVLSFSMGGVASLLAAAEEPHLRALAVDSAYANIDDLFAGEVSDRTPLPAWTLSIFQPGMEMVGRARYGIRLSALKPEEFVGDIDIPLLMIHATDDDRIPTDHSERITSAAAHPDTRLRLFPSGGHSRAYSAHPDDYLRLITEYFGARLNR